MLALLQLIRAPNVFTAIADVAMGVLVVSGDQVGWPGFVALSLASAALYSAGMILNDVCDYEVDARLRPERPIPSGRVSLRFATRLACFLMGFGVVVALTAGFNLSPAEVAPWRAGLVAALLTLSIVLYDSILKTTPLAPLVMGTCRMLNVLLGMSLLATPNLDASFQLLGYTTYHLAIAAGIGTYIVGVTLFARREAEGSTRLQLTAGLVVMLVGISLLAAAPRWAAEGTRFYLEPNLVWPGALCLLTVVVVRRCIVAIASPLPQQVQAAVKQCILSLIVLDAAVALLVGPWYFAVAVLALLIPTMFLGRWVYST